MPAEGTGATPTTSQTSRLSSPVQVVIGTQHISEHEPHVSYEHCKYYRLPCRLQTFTGRVGQLMKLELSLTRYASSIINNAPIPEMQHREQHLSGLGGVGKTSLALEYAHRMLSNNRYDYVIWLNGNNADQMMLEMMDLAIALKLGQDHKHLKDKYFTNQNIITAIYNHLYTTTSYRRVLIVFDSVDQLAMLKGQAPAVQTTTHAHSSVTPQPAMMLPAEDGDDDGEEEEGTGLLLQIHRQTEQQSIITETLNFMPIAGTQVTNSLHWIITTRDQSEQTLYPERHLALQGFSPQEAIQYIQSRLGWNIDVVSCQRLAHTLHYFPLALSQAVASIKQMDHLDIEAYLAVYNSTKEAQRDYLASKSPYPDPYKEAVYTTWRISDEKLSEPAREMIRLLSFLYANDIPLPLIDKLGELTHQLNALQTRGVITSLIGSSLIQPDQQEVDLIPTFKMHRMLQEVMQLTLMIESEGATVGQYLPKIIECVDTVYPWEKQFKEQVAMVRLLILHGEELLRLTKRDICCPVSEVDICREHILLILGDAYGALGNVVKKRDVLIEAVSIKEKHYGVNHCEVAKTLGNLATAYGDLGEYKVAINLLERSLAIQKENFRWDSWPLLFKTRGNLAHAYTREGRLREAEIIQEEVLEMTEAYYGKNSREIAPPLINLAMIYGELGRAAQKRKEVLERALAILESHCDADHYDIATVLNNLAIAYGDLGILRKKKELLERALIIKRRHYGNEHHDTLISSANLATVYAKLGKHTIARNMLKQAVAKLELHYGENNPIVARIKCNLASEYGSIGCLEEQKNLLEESLSVFEQHGRRKDIQVAEILESLGNLYGILRRSDQSKVFFGRALSIFKEYYGDCHPKVAMVLTGIATVSHDNLETRMKMLERALSILEHCYPDGHYTIAKVLVNLATIHGLKGNAFLKKQLLQRSLDIKMAYYGSHNAEVAIVLFNLGNAEGQVGNIRKAIEYIKKAHEMIISCEGYGASHPQAIQMGEMLVDLEPFSRLPN